MSKGRDHTLFALQSASNGLFNKVSLLGIILFRPLETISLVSMCGGNKLSKKPFRGDHTGLWRVKNDVEYLCHPVTNGINSSSKWCIYSAQNTLCRHKTHTLRQQKRLYAQHYRGAHQNP